jgi:hypothetical protein
MAMFNPVEAQQHITEWGTIPAITRRSHGAQIDALVRSSQLLESAVEYITGLEKQLADAIVLARAGRRFHERMTVAEAVISRARECVREEYSRDQVMAVLNNPLPPLLIPAPTEPEKEN